MNDSKERVVLVGRSTACHIVIDNKSVSSTHAKFIIKNNVITLEDTGSTNGTYVNGEKITSRNVTQSDVITFSKSYTFDWKLLEPFIKMADGATQLPKEERLHTVIAREKTLITIGRTSDNDLVINNIKVSRKHAKLEKTGNDWFLEDLNSSNGTFINGRKIKKEKVAPKDIITIGGVPLNLGTLYSAEKEIKGDIQIATDDVVFKVKDRTIVDEIGLTILPGEFVGLIGPSGAGKTSLMMMMNGVVRPSTGDVFINSQSLYSNFDLFKGQIGYVPQDDIIHRELKVKESFEYTGRLRLDNYSNEDISTQIEGVLETLGLEDTRDTLIGSAEKKGISGGQRKRVNLGQELLTEPSILFLDEPTSGLDPKTDLDVMYLLKNIAAKGKIVILTTHNITKDNFEILSHLIVLTKGGKLAYFGKASKAVDYFEVNKPYEIFEKLETKEPDYWKDKFRKSSEYKQFVESRKNSVVQSQPTKVTSETKKRRADLKQYLTLTSRYFKVKLRDNVSTAILLLQAPIIAVLIALVFNEPEEKTAALFILVIAAVWLGCSNAAREIVSEQAIYKRERMVNLKIPSYLFSKITVLLFLCVIQCFVLAIIVVPSLDMNSSVTGMFFMLLLTSLPALTLGLVVSSLVSTTEAAMGLIPLVLIPQVILGGLISTFTNMSTLEKLLAAFMPARWSFEALTIFEYKGYYDQGIDALGFSASNFAVDIIMILGYSVLYFLLTAYSLKRKDVR
ncbi:ABC transporter ATP-binding/permease protein [bacterium BMS3Abin03]|nr:ABC transporter ATP-binding/permease protein [bacterium BMS3Abin03]